MSRAVARDLRRHYGEAHRIVRAESAGAPETLQEFKLRGETVAMLVADYRMPQMTGIQFLEQAMDLYPAARRVLLTASPTPTPPSTQSTSSTSITTCSSRGIHPKRSCIPSSMSCWRSGGGPRSLPSRTPR